MNCLKTAELFDFSHSLAGDALRDTVYPFEILKEIGALIEAIGEQLDKDEFEQIGEKIWAAKDASIAPTASITGPCIIGHGTEVRHCAFIRGNALIGDGCVVGNSTELKNVILFDCVQVPHYNYVGDSVLGYRSHMGAGSITSNVKSDKTPVAMRNGDDRLDTELKKCGAFLGDFVEVGCGSVLNPGTVIGKNASVYPLSSVRGTVPEGGIYKKQGEVAQRR